MELAVLLSEVVFWQCFFGALFLGSILEYFDTSWTSFLVFLVFLSCVQWVCKFAIFAWIAQSWGLVLLGMLVYVAIGILWSFFRWMIFLKDEVNKLEEAVASAKPKNLDELEKVRYNWGVKRPRFTEHKADIAHWIGCWMTSMLWFAGNDATRRSFTWVAGTFAKGYRAIEDKVYGSVEEKIKERLGS